MLKKRVISDGTGIRKRRQSVFDDTKKEVKDKRVMVEQQEGVGVAEEEDPKVEREEA